MSIMELSSDFKSAKNNYDIQSSFDNIFLVYDFNVTNTIFKNVTTVLYITGWNLMT